MAATPSVKIVKTFNWRQQARLFSNRYHFVGGTPADATHWHTFMDAVTAAEKLIYANTVTIVDAVGYAAGSDVPVASKAYSLAGTYSPASTAKQAVGEAAALVRYSTDIRTAKNHPVYLFNYYHGVFGDYAGSDEQDLLMPAQQSLMLTYANAWISGFSDGTNTLHRAGPNGAVALGALVDDYLTHRDFPR